MGIRSLENRTEALYDEILEDLSANEQVRKALQANARGDDELHRVLIGDIESAGPPASENPGFAHKWELTRLIARVGAYYLQVTAQRVDASHPVEEERVDEARMAHLYGLYSLYGGLQSFAAEILEVDLATLLSVAPKTEETLDETRRLLEVAETRSEIRLPSGWTERPPEPANRNEISNKDGPSNPAELAAVLSAVLRDLWPMRDASMSQQALINQEIRDKFWRGDLDSLPQTEFESEPTAEEIAESYR